MNCKCKTTKDNIRFRIKSTHYVVNLKKSELNKENKELEKMIIDYTELSLSIVYDAVDREIEKRGNKKC